jgi:hypothetical protein
MEYNRSESSANATASSSYSAKNVSEREEKGLPYQTLQGLAHQFITQASGI